MPRRVRSGHAWARASVLIALGAFACSQVLGIEEAHVDPSLGASGSASGGAGANVTTNGGNAGTSAAGGGSSGRSSGGSSGSDGGFDAGGDVGSGGASVAGAGGDGGAGNGGSLCDQYCDVVTEFCSTTSLQYKDRDQCLKVCALLPPGKIGDPDGNSVACRLKYAGKARYAGGTELSAYCRQAGPGGDGRCGSNCDGFCSITMATCNETETEPYYFPTEAACLSTCKGLPNVPYVYGDVSVADGNSVQCRLFHGISAVMADAEEHCEHVMGLTLCEATP